MAKVSRSMRWFLWAALAVLVCGLSFYFDTPVQDWMERHETARAEEFMGFVSRSGDWPAHVALGVAGAAIAYAMKHRRWVRIFVLMIIACVVAGILARAIKIGSGRARPSVQSEVEWNGPRLHSKYHAFPSGHVASSSAFFGVLAFANWPIGAVGLAATALIGFSRMYVDAHHLSDVVCAAVLGVMTAWFLARGFLRPRCWRGE